MADGLQPGLAGLPTLGEALGGTCSQLGRWCTVSSLARHPSHGQSKEPLSPKGFRLKMKRRSDLQDLDRGALLPRGLLGKTARSPCWRILRVRGSYEMVRKMSTVIKRKKSCDEGHHSSVYLTTWCLDKGPCPVNPKCHPFAC